MKGYQDGSFGPGQQITREQAAAVLYRYAQAKGYATDKKIDLRDWADGAKVSFWAVDAVRWAVGSDLITAAADGQISPSGSVTSAEIESALELLRKNTR